MDRSWLFRIHSDCHCKGTLLGCSSSTFNSAKTHLATIEGALIILQSVYGIYMQKISGHLHRKILFHQFHYSFIPTHTSVLRILPEIQFNSNVNNFF